ncbi:hypothetical protein ACHWQZ_G004902 [Mnemiopsis leidyi]
MRKSCSLLSNGIRVFSTRQLSWQVQSSVIVERPPQCQPPLDPLIARYQHMRETLRIERSVYNDFELAAESRKEQIVSERKQKFPPKHKFDLPEYFSSADEKALLDPVKNDDYLPLKPQGVSNTDKTSVKLIKPHSSVFLIVKSGEGWNFPHKVVDKEGSLEEAAVAALSTHPDNKDLCVEVSSRLPVSVHVNKYSRKYQQHTQLTGVKTFFMKSRLSSGNFSGDTFMWCTKEELGEFLSKDVLKCVEPCLK